MQISQNLHLITMRFNLTWVISHFVLTMKQLLEKYCHILWFSSVRFARFKILIQWWKINMKERGSFHSGSRINEMNTSQRLLRLTSSLCQLSHTCFLLSPPHEIKLEMRTETSFLFRRRRWRRLRFNRPEFKDQCSYTLDNLLWPIQIPPCHFENYTRRQL